MQGKYRLGDTLIWAGLRYGFAETEVSFDAPAACHSAAMEIGRASCRERVS